MPAQNGRQNARPQNLGQNGKMNHMPDETSYLPSYTTDLPDQPTDCLARTHTKSYVQMLKKCHRCLPSQYLDEIQQLKLDEPPLNSELS